MVKDSIMKLKKKSKLKAELPEVSAKKTSKSDSVANENFPNGVSEGHPKHKKSKKHKRDRNENEHPMKKMKIENASDKDQKGNGTSMERSSRSSKHALMARLRNAASDFKTCTSLLHVHKRKSNNDDGSDDGVQGGTTILQEHQAKNEEITKLQEVISSLDIDPDIKALIFEQQKIIKSQEIQIHAYKKILKNLERKQKEMLSMFCED